MNGKLTGEVLQYMNRLLDRVYDSAVNEQDCHARIVLSRIQTIVDDDFRLHLDNCIIQTRQDLKTTMEAWESSHGGFGFGWGKHYKLKRHSPLVCHTCHKPGHKAIHCRSAQVEPGNTQFATAKDYFMPRCFSCEVMGNKSLDFPNHTKNQDSADKKLDTGPKKDKTQKHQQQSPSRMLRITTPQLLFYGQQLFILLDTGAEMTVVPEEFTLETSAVVGL